MDFAWPGSSPSSCRSDADEGRAAPDSRPDLRHSYASLLLQKGAPITYVSRQLGHKDPSITLRVYAHWLPDVSRVTLVDALDDASPHVTQASPTTSSAEIQNALSAVNRVVSHIFTSWNRMAAWLRQIEGLRRAT